MTRWQSYVEQRFPAYLLPSACGQRLSEDAAREFLRRVLRSRASLEDLRRTALLHARYQQIHEFAHALLPGLIRSLPSTTEVLQRRWTGGFKGRLALAPTLREHLQGQCGVYVTRDRRRTFDRPENRLVAWVCDALLDVLKQAQAAEIATESIAYRTALGAEAPLLRWRRGSYLEAVPAGPVTSQVRAAAAQARHPAYAAALELCGVIQAALHGRDEALTAQLIAEGALLPLDEPTRFELAVLLRTVECLERIYGESTASTMAWTMERTTIVSGRRDIATWRHPSGREVRVYYNQAVFDAGPLDRASAHYLGVAGRMRPDVTIEWLEGGRSVDACVLEVKLTESPHYAVQGLAEAFTYAREYESRFHAEPHALLVTSRAVLGEPRPDDAVVALDWSTLAAGDALVDLLRRKPWALTKLACPAPSNAQPPAG